MSALSTGSMAVEIEGVLIKENVNNVKKWSKTLFFSAIVSLSCPDLAAKIPG